MQNCTCCLAYMVELCTNTWGCSTGLNLIVAFANALKHKLRFEPGIDYDDLRGYVQYLDTFAKAAEKDLEKPGKKTPWKSAGEYLGVSFAESNPQKLIKRSKKPLGNLPVEILTHLSAYIDSLIANGTLSVPIYQTQAGIYPTFTSSIITQAH